MKIKKSISFEGEFIHGEINDEIAHLEIRSDDYTAKQVQELIVELQKVLQELPKGYLVREFSTTPNVGSTTVTTHIGESVTSTSWNNRGIKSDTEATFED